MGTGEFNAGGNLAMDWGSRNIPSRFMPRKPGDVAALLRSHMIGLLPFESTIEQTTETMPLSLTQ